jgi:general secretion pathway protein G
MKSLMKRWIKALLTDDRKVLLRGTAKSQKGFNLIEIMVAITIIGVLMAVVGINVLGALGTAKQDASKASMGSIQNALLMYKLDNGKYPSTSEGLQALINAPSSSKRPGKKYITGDSLPRDGFDNEFVYFSPGTHGNNDFELISYGEDNAAGGEGLAADINSWEINK